MAPLELICSLKPVLILGAKNWLRPKGMTTYHMVRISTQNLSSFDLNYYSLLLISTPQVMTYSESFFSSSSPSSPHSSLDCFEVFFKKKDGYFQVRERYRLCFVFGGWVRGYVLKVLDLLNFGILAMFNLLSSPILHVVS